MWVCVAFWVGKFGTVGAGEVCPCSVWCECLRFYQIGSLPFCTFGAEQTDLASFVAGFPFFGLLGLSRGLCFLRVGDYFHTGYRNCTMSHRGGRCLYSGGFSETRSQSSNTTSLCCFGQVALLVCRLD